MRWFTPAVWLAPACWFPPKPWLALSFWFSPYGWLAPKHWFSPRSWLAPKQWVSPIRWLARHFGFTHDVWLLSSFHLLAPPHPRDLLGLWRQDYTALPPSASGGSRLGLASLPRFHLSAQLKFIDLAIKIRIIYRQLLSKINISTIMAFLAKHLIVQWII